MSCVEETRPYEGGRLFEKQQQPEKKPHKERFEFVGEPKQLKAEDEGKDQNMDMAEDFDLTSGFLGVGRGVWYYGAFYVDDIEELQQQPEKKRHREGFESEGEPKQPKAEDKGTDHEMDMGEVVDGDFYEGDSDAEDIRAGFATVDLGLWDHEDIKKTSYPVDIYPRSCLKQPLCNMYLHNSMSSSDFLFELFKVQLIRNPKCSSPPPPEGRFSGAIELTGSMNHKGSIYYYSVSEKDAVSIKFDSPDNKVLIPISNPDPIVPIASQLFMPLRFYFKFNGKDLFDGVNYELSDGADGNCTPNFGLLIVNGGRMGYREPGCFPPRIVREMIGEPDSDPFLVVAYYSIYFGAQAKVSVRILKKGVISCSGFIYARPCVYASRIRLLSTRGDQKIQLDKSGSVKLTKSVVAVPSFSSLIITAQLYDQDGKEIFHVRTFFPASDKGSPSKMIKDKDGVPNLQVTVHWN